VIRLFASLLICAALVTAAVFVADRPGSVTLVWSHWRIDTSVAVLALGTAFVAMAASWLAVLLRRLWRLPGNLLRARRERRRREGYRALTQGMAAVAAGEPDEAERFARRANVLLNEPPLTLLLSAQAAQLKGDEQAARRYFSAMLDQPETAFLGLRGLIVQALKSGHDALALKLIDQARQLRPRTAWVLRARFELLARAGNWEAAEAALAETQKRRAIEAAEARHHRAVLAHEKALAAKAGGQPDQAAKLVAQAFNLAPDLAPVAAWHAANLLAQGHKRRARKALEQAWQAAPHPDLAAAYGGIYADETDLARVQRFEKLLDLQPENPESRIALARAALKARLWGEARRHLQAAGGETPRIARLLAEIEAGEHGDGPRARAWLDRAARGELPDPAYACNSCGYSTASWSALCPRCRGFDQLVWRKRPGALTTPGILAPATLLVGGERAQLLEPAGRSSSTPSSL